METKHLTIMFTDMKGFTSRTAVHTRDQLEKLLDLQDELICPIFERYKGKVVKTIGDAFMVIFHSPTDAVLCGMKIQEELVKYNEKADKEEKMEIRVGINSGEANIKGDDYFGEAVNIASRIESIAEPNEVYFTESVYLSMNKNEIPSLEIGIRRLKGIPDEIKVYKVLHEEDEVARLKNERKRMADISDGFSKSSGGAINKKQEKNSVKITRMILISLGCLIGFFILMSFFMWIFKICPSAGPWPTPPWCMAKKEIIPAEEKKNNKNVEPNSNLDIPREEIEKIAKDTRRAITNGDIKMSKEGLDKLVKINEKWRNPDLKTVIDDLKRLFDERFLINNKPKIQP